MKKLLFALVVASICLAQAPQQNNTVTVVYADTPAASASVLTVQQPATGANEVEAVFAHIYCSVACVVELERDGTAATATGATEVGTTSSTLTPAATAFTGSDVGNGTTVDTFTIVADSVLVVDLTAYRLWLIGNGTSKNFTLRTDSITGTVRMTIVWREW
jgi:hypothetical protein